MLKNLPKSDFIKNIILTGQVTRFIVKVVTIVSALIFALFVIYFSEFEAFSQMLLSSYGLLGVFVLILILDIVISPIPPDILVFGSAIAGADFLTVALIGAFGSFVAGILDYKVGRKVGEKGFSKWFGEDHLVKGKKLFAKYGVHGLFIGAFSPIPYSSICWAAGIYEMHFSRFVITSLLARTPRFLLTGFVGSLF